MDVAVVDVVVAVVGVFVRSDGVAGVAEGAVSGTWV